CFREKKWRSEIHFDRFTPFVGREIGKARRSSKCRVVHEDVHSTKSLDCATYDFRRHSVRGDITGNRQGATAKRRGKFFGTFPIANIYCDGRSSLVKPLRCGAAQSTRCTSDYRDAAGEIIESQVADYRINRL